MNEIGGIAGKVRANVDQACKRIGLGSRVYSQLIHPGGRLRRLAMLRRAQRDAAIFDGRNIFDPAEVEAAGIAYWGIGRGRSIRGDRA